MIGQETKPTEITGLGEIRFDRTLQESKKWLEKEYKFDSSCGATNYRAEPCARTFLIKKHIHGLYWDEAIATYYKDSLILIKVNSPSKEFMEVFKLKYGKSDTTDYREYKDTDCPKKTTVNLYNWNFTNGTAEERYQISCKNFIHILEIERKDYDKKLWSILYNCEKAVKDRIKLRCDEKLRKKYNKL